MFIYPPPISYFHTSSYTSEWEVTLLGNRKRDCLLRPSGSKAKE
jgi:hypothetical protein